MLSLRYLTFSIEIYRNFLPAFYTIFRNQGRIVKEEVKPHPILSKLYRASVPETLTFPAYEVPMKCPPVPWISHKMGGYLVLPCEMVRLPHQAIMQKQRLNDLDPKELYPSLDSLNQLASIPWKVNRKILDVILEVSQMKLHFFSLNQSIGYFDTIEKFHTISGFKNV